MRSYSIPDLLVDTFYAPQSLARRFRGGKINYASKRDDVYVGEGYECYSIRYRVDNSWRDEWATIAIRLPD